MYFFIHYLELSDVYLFITFDLTFLWWGGGEACFDGTSISAYSALVRERPQTLRTKLSFRKNLPVVPQRVG